jgi:hypothetical protein
VIVVERVRTPLDMKAFPALISGAFETLGRPLSDTQRANLSVICAIETGQGKSVQNWNIGAISAAPSYPFEVWRPPWFDPPTPVTSERNRRLHAEMKAGRAPSAFRAYGSPEEGAEDFARMLLKVFPEVLQAADSANPDALRAALAQKYSRDYADPRHTATIAKLQLMYGLKAPLLAGGSAAALVLLLVAAAALARR